MKSLFLTLIAALSCHFVLAAKSDDLAWEHQIVAACLILEASNQGESGMQAVAAVIGNRGDGDVSRYLAIVQKPYAFSALNGSTGSGRKRIGYASLVSRASKDLNWSTALQIVDDLYAGELKDNTFGADHYSRKDELPSWSHGMRATTVIGDHLFFKSP